MFSSLSSRIQGLGACIACMVLALVALQLDASAQMHASARQVAHTERVMMTLYEVMANLREAESGQRGFLLTRNPAFARTFHDRVADTRGDFATLRGLVSDNPAQVERTGLIGRAIAERIGLMTRIDALGRTGRFDEAVAIVAGGLGRELMNTVSAEAEDMLREERRLLAERTDLAGRRLRWSRQVAVFGAPLVLGMILLMMRLVRRGVRRPLDGVLTAMEALGTDDAVRVPERTGSSEFDRLATGYNAMAGRLEQAIAARADSDERLREANEALRANGETLRTRGEVIELLGGMAHRMQAARTDGELAAVVACFLPRVLPGMAGTLYAHNNSRNLVVRVADWGGDVDAAEHFAPDACWGLRRGQGHFVTHEGADIVCAHVGPHDLPYHCEPLLAGGDVVGMLHLKGVVGVEDRFRLTLLAENIASALVNHGLQRGLREQTIRDPLTGLFNRRYMEETLTTEIARAARGTAPLSIAMCDVDHFKRFNDEFGHDAGDAVLQAVGAELQRHFRDGDVVCRYGGEEFTIIAPGATPDALHARVERLRMAMAALDLRAGGQRLGPVSMSFGIADWAAPLGREPGGIVSLADGALYRAKREGRNRAIIDRLAA